MTWKDIIELALKLIGLLVTLGLFKWAKDKYIHFKKNRDTFRLLQTQQMDIFIKKLSSIKAQVNPNGGKSLNDKITFMSSQMEEFTVVLNDLKIGQRNNREIMDVAAWESDKEGRTFYVSQSLCEMLGMSQDDLLDFSWTGMIVAADRDRITKRWFESIRTASPFDEEYIYQKPDGYFQKVQGIAIHNKGKDGKVITSLGRLVKIGEPYKSH